MEDELKYMEFIWEVPPEGTLDELREFITEDFKSLFGDINCSITMKKVKEKDGIRFYTGCVQEVI
jgi:hypothetical protein